MGVCMSMECEEQKEKKRLDREVLRAEAKAAQLLAEMPGRLCSNAATKAGSLHTKPGCKGINQDSMLVWEGFASEEESVFLGVFDGHGPNGHLIANKVRDCLPSLLTLPLEYLLEGCDTPHHHICKPIKITAAKDSADFDKDTQSMKNAAVEMQDFAEDIDDSGSIEERFTAAFHKMDERLKLHPKISCMSSGTTAIAILLQGNDLVVGSVGDSRAIVATRSVDGSLVARPLTTELKPDSPGEKERIVKCQGRVFALKEEPHIQRLWLPHANTPGLAMARALGDFCLKEHGLIATPCIFHRKLCQEDELIVLATDGVWDVMSNAEVLRVVCSSASKAEAAKAIVDAATAAWKMRNLAHRMDDCTVVCHFLKEKKPDLSSKLDMAEVRKADEPKDFNLDQTDNSQLAQANQPLARYDTMVACDLTDELNASELKKEEDDAAKPVTDDLPLARRNALPATDLADELNALELKQEEEAATKKEGQSTSPEAENGPTLARYGTLANTDLSASEAPSA